MTKKVKNIALAFAVTALGLSACGLVGVNTVSATGNTPDIANDEYRVANFFVDGYSVRLPSSETDEYGYGVRFYVRMTKELYDALPQGATTGTLFLPQSLIGEDQALTIEDSTAWDCPTTDEWYAVTDNDVAYMESVVYCYDIPEENYGSDIAVVGYVNDGTEYYYSATTQARSMSWVAKNEYNNENSKLNATQKAELKAEYLDCTVTLDGEEYATVTYGEKIPAPDTTSDSSPYYAYNTIYTGAYNSTGTAKWDFEKDTVIGDVNLTTFSMNVSDGELENFSTFDSYINAKATSNLAGQDAKWEESKTDNKGVIKYGVASVLNASGDTRKNYHVVTSATAEPNQVIRYNIGANGEYFYYQSIWALIEVDGEVTVALGDGYTQKVQGGEWTELKLYKPAIQSRGADMVQKWGDCLSTDCNESAYTFYIENADSNAVRVYFDCIQMKNGVAVTASAENGEFVVGSEITVTGDYNGNGAQLNASSAFQSVTYTYSVKDKLGNTVTVSSDGKFTPTMVGEYEVTVTATAVYNANGVLNGKTVTVSDTQTISVKQAGTVINSFDTQADTTACGWKGKDETGSQVNGVTWHKTFQGADGVVQLDGLQTGNFSNFYIEANSNWDRNALSAYLTENSGDNDYIAIKLWIADNKVETTKVYTRLGAQTVNCNEWVTIELKISDLLEKRSSTANDWTNDNNYLFCFYPKDFGENAFTEENNVTVYIDSVMHVEKKA